MFHRRANFDVIMRCHWYRVGESIWQFFGQSEGLRGNPMFSNERLLASDYNDWNRYVQVAMAIFV